MTVGEKIQFYRKKNGLSQEDLGQKMLVSRQTVSLWEMDKTLPTVDNLRRLKEIFDVSIDDILSEDNPVEENNVSPEESYMFQYSADELREVFKLSKAPTTKKIISFFVIFIVLILGFIGNDAPDIIIGLMMGWLLVVTVSHIVSHMRYKKSMKICESKMVGSSYLYEIFDNYFVLKISNNNELTKTLKLYFDDIETIQNLGKYILLQISGQLYIIKKELLIADSVFYSLRNNTPEKADAKKTDGTFKTISGLLVALSVASIFGAMFLIATISGNNNMLPEIMWMFFLFTPIPIASVVYGFYLKKKGYKYKKNVVVGIVMIVLLSVYGSFSFAFWDMYSHDDAPVATAEKLLSIDIPEYSNINTNDWYDGTQSSLRGNIISFSDIYFEENAVTVFEKNIDADSKWLSSVSSELIGITAYLCDYRAYDYIIIYNKQTGQFNKLPQDSGTYEFINVLYNKESNTMHLIEYEIEYIR